MPTAIDVTGAASELRIVLGRLVRRLRAENTLPLPHATVLGRLDRGGPRTTSALAAAEQVRPQSMAQTVKDLIDAGLVERRPDPADGRQLLLELTGRGIALLREERQQRDGWLSRTIAERLSPDEQEILVRAVPLLQRLTDA